MSKVLFNSYENAKKVEKIKAIKLMKNADELKNMLDNELTVTGLNVVDEDDVVTDEGVVISIRTTYVFTADTCYKTTSKYFSRTMIDMVEFLGSDTFPLTIKIVKVKIADGYNDALGFDVVE